MGTSRLVQELARTGARERLKQLDAERAAILRAFPDSGKSGIKPRRTVSEKDRAAMSAGMRRFWRRRKAAERAK